MPPYTNHLNSVAEILWRNFGEFCTCYERFSSEIVSKDYSDNNNTIVQQAVRPVAARHLQVPTHKAITTRQLLAITLVTSESAGLCILWQ